MRPRRLAIVCSQGEMRERCSIERSMREWIL
jgi:hypothetical protein